MNQFLTKHFNFFHHIVSGYGAVGINILIFGFLTPYMLHNLGKEQYGIWQLVSNISMYFSMSALGLGSAFHVEFAKIKSDIEKSQRLINTIFFAYLAVGAVSILGFLVLLSNFESLFIISDSLLAKAKLTFVFSYLAFLTTFIFGFLDVILFLHNKITTRNIIDIARISANGLGSLLLIYLGFDIVSIAVLSLFVVMCQYVYNYYFTKKLQPYRISFTYFDFTYLKSLYKSGFYFFVYALSGLIIFNTDNIIISHFMGAESVSLYAVIFRFVTISEKFIIVIAMVKVPKMSNFIASGNFTAVLDLYRKSWLATLGVSVAVAVFLSIFGIDILTIWLGDKLKFDIVLMWIFSAFIVVHSLSNVTAQYFGSLNIIKTQSAISTLEVVANLVLSVVFYHQFGLRGIALGTLISHILITSWYPGLYLLKYLNNKIKLQNAIQA